MRGAVGEARPAPSRNIIKFDEAQVLQNAVFYLNFLWQEGTKLGGKIFDTMFALQMRNNNVPNASNTLEAILWRASCMWSSQKSCKKRTNHKEVTPGM